MNTNAINRVCETLGSQAALARVLDVSAVTVNQWVSGTRPIPAERCPEIEKATRGAIRCEDLRPDVNWQYLRGTKKKAA